MRNRAILLTRLPALRMTRWTFRFSTSGFVMNAVSPSWHTLEFQLAHSHRAGTDSRDRIWGDTLGFYGVACPVQGV